MEWIPVTQILLNSVNAAFHEQVRLRKEKELYGMPLCFEGQRLRLVKGWGAAEDLNTFGIAFKSEIGITTPFKGISRLDTTHIQIF
ncbi:unnamed protein product [Heterobilharzia americana]|nr:unnamed protein product [Heterobilharzia americana]